MRDTDKTTKPDQKRSTIFISLPSSFPSQWTSLIHGRAKDFGLTALVYHGIPQSPFEQINNAEYEARGDMYSAKFVFAALAVTDAPEIDGIWIIKHIPTLKTYGINFDLALVGEGASDCADDRYVVNVSSDIRISRFPTSEKWLTFLSDEIRKCSTSLLEKSA